MSSFEAQQEASQAEQANKLREEILEEMKHKNEHAFDPETAPKISHNWKHYGLRSVCFGAGHPRHEAYSRLPMK